MIPLLRGIKPKHNEDFYCLNCFLLFRTEKNLKKHYKACKNHDYFCVEMPREVNKILKYNHGQKSMTVPFITDAEFLPEKMNTC